MRMIEDVVLPVPDLPKQRRSVVDVINAICESFSFKLNVGSILRILSMKLA